MKNAVTQPNIFQFLDYRAFVKEMYYYRKKRNPSFSHRTFSRLAGFKSSNYLKLVTDGKRNLSNDAIFKFAKALKLNGNETSFFEKLVLFGQAKNMEEKNHHFEKLTQFRHYSDVRQLEIRQHAYFSNWYYVALRELVSHTDFTEEASYINCKLDLKLKPASIHRAIQMLIDLGLLIRDDQGRLRQTTEKIVTSYEIADLTIINFQKEMIQKATDALEKTPAPWRDISSLTLNLTQGQYDRIKERINQFRREIHSIGGETLGTKAVYQINFQLFNLTEIPWN